MAHTLYITHTILALTFACQVAVGGDLSPLPIPLADDQSQISFAAGAVEFVCGPEYRASELPRGRQILLVLSRHAPPQTPAELVDGFWIAFHPRSKKVGRSQSALAASLQKDYRRIEMGQRSAVRLAGCNGVRQEFTLPRLGALFGAPGDKKWAPQQALRGWRQMLAAEEAAVEIHFVAPQAVYQNRLRDLERTLASLRLGSPRLEQPAVGPELVDAQSIIGVWKSSRALIEISGDGALTLTYDRKQSYELDKLGLVDFEKPVKKLAGEYRADGDLLRVRWADGSLLNMRWRLADGELFITDHQGRTRRLSRIFR